MEPVSHPFSPKLEAEVLPSTEKIITAVNALIGGKAPVQRRARLEHPAVKPGEGKVHPTPVVALDVSLETVPPAPPNQEVLAGEAIIMPHGDLTVSEAKVVNWLKNVGDIVAAGEGIVEVETDKAVLQIDAPNAGRLAQVLAPVGNVVKMGETLGILVSP
jgi:biotin carboxyl carrier protein